MRRAGRGGSLLVLVRVLLATTDAAGAAGGDEADLEGRRAAEGRANRGRS